MLAYGSMEGKVPFDLNVDAYPALARAFRVGRLLSVEVRHLHNARRPHLQPHTLRTAAQ